MLSLGVWELVVIAAVLLIFVGPERLPKVMRWAGRQYGTLRRAADDMRRAFVLEADRQDAEERYQELQRRRAEARAAREQALEDAGEGTVAQDEVLPGGADVAPYDTDPGDIEPVSAEPVPAAEPEQPLDFEDAVEVDPGSTGGAA